jgi:hypothetical protein
MRERPPRPGLPRRDVLRALALAPAALAGCAATRAAIVAPAGEAAAAPPQPQPAHAPSPRPGAVAAVRGYHLAADAEPAFVFRAAAARPGEPR